MNDLKKMDENAKVKKNIENAKSAELRRKKMEGKLIAKYDVVVCLRKLKSDCCESCQEPFDKIIENVEGF